MRKNTHAVLSKRVNHILIILILMLFINVNYKIYELYIPNRYKINLLNAIKNCKKNISEQILMKEIPLFNYTYLYEKNINNEMSIRQYKTSYYNKFLSSSVPLINYILKYNTKNYQTVTEIYPQITKDLKENTSDTLEKLKNINEDENFSESIEQQHPKSYIYSLSQLQNFNFLLQNVYTVDNSLNLTLKDFPIKKLLNKNLKVNFNSNNPKILIYHTHSQESFKDSSLGVQDDTVVGLGSELARLLKENYGINVIHHKGVYDMIDGKLDRSKAYALIEKPLKNILKKYPSIEVIIDIHRDGIPENVKLVTNIDSKPTAKIMFFNGLCKLSSSSYTNPFIEDNMGLSLQMQLKAGELYPGLTRKIYLKGYRYNMHLCPKSLLIEVGAQTNTVSEAKNAMKPLAKILYEVLK